MSALSFGLVAQLSCEAFWGTPAPCSRFKVRTERLQSEVESDAALRALVRRVDLGDPGIWLALQVPIPIADSQLQRERSGSGSFLSSSSPEKRWLRWA